MISRKPSALYASLLCIAGAVLWSLPDEEIAVCRTAVRDVLRPGLSLLKISLDRGGTAVRRFRQSLDQSEQVAQLKESLSDWELRYRQLQIQNALLRERLADNQNPDYLQFSVVSSEPLLVPELLEATVLGEENAELWRSGKLIDKGRADGLIESALVLEDPDPLIDQGTSAGLQTGQPVYAGRIVFGKISRVGRWSSTVQPVTHPNYRGRARLGRTTESGLVFGAEGILAGDGKPTCRLLHVSSTVPVSVGDEVYTDTGDGLFPYPMYYGKVVKAELKPGSPRWEIAVQPAAGELNVRTVQILCKRINPERVAREKIQPYKQLQ